MKPFLLGALCVFVMSARAQFTTGNYTYSGHAVGFYQFLPADYSPTSAHKFPLIISLGGVGEEGNGTTELPNMLDAGLPLYCSQGATLQFNYQGQHESFLMLAPQLSKAEGDWQDYYVDAMIAYAKANFNVDVNRIFLTGFSLGGGGVWKYITSSTAQSANIAGIIPIAGTNEYNSGNFCADVSHSQVAVWAFHSADDGTVSPSFTAFAVSSINSCTPQIPARERLYPDGGHAVWNTKVYDTTNYWQYPNIYQWMMKTSRSINVATDVPPVANATPSGNITLTVPVRDENIILNGLPSTDADDIVAEYKWRQTGGTTTYFLSTTGYGPSDSSERPVASIVAHSNGSHDWMNLGTYTYKLSIIDYKSQPSTTTVSYTVALPASGNALPGAWIGAPDSVVLSPTTTTTGFGGSGKDWDGTLSGYSWTQISGPSTLTLTGADGPSVGVSNVTAPGIYKIVFAVKDNQNGFGYDTATILKLSASLPVTWLYFKGASAGGHNQLSWATATENNNDHFEVYRSADGTAFTDIGQVAATDAPNGSVYSFADVTAPQGVSYYRLTQVDKDGKATYSDIIKINNTGGGYAIETYPNPAKDNLSVVINGSLYGNLQVTVTDMTGRIVKQLQWTKTQAALTKNIDLTGLQSGLYQLVLVSPDGKKEATGFVKY